ncbi:hypothetical protein NFI96_005908, partial [Prochilodus magdalenae]
RWEDAQVTVTSGGVEGLVIAVYMSVHETQRVVLVSRAQRRHSCRDPVSQSWRRRGEEEKRRKRARGEVEDEEEKEVAEEEEAEKGEVGSSQFEVAYGDITCPQCGYKAASSLTEVTISIGNSLSCNVQNASIQRTDTTVVVGSLMPGNTYLLRINCSTLCCSNFSTCKL